MPAGDDVRALFGPLGEGTSIERHFRIESLHAMHKGAIPVVMSTGDIRYAVEILRADAGGPPPLARAGALAFYLSNRGDGDTATPEAAGLGVLALARALGARLAAGATPPPALRTHRERRAAHPHGVFHVPLAPHTA